VPRNVDWSGTKLGRRGVDRSGRRLGRRENEERDSVEAVMSHRSPTRAAPSVAPRAKASGRRSGPVAAAARSRRVRGWVAKSRQCRAATRARRIGQEETFVISHRLAGEAPGRAAADLARSRDSALSDRRTAWVGTRTRRYDRAARCSTASRRTSWSSR